MSKRLRATETTPLVSIVIPHYMRYDLLQDCLDAIAPAFGEIAYEVILVENGTPKDIKRPGLANIVLPPHTRLIELTQNVGYPGACNRGAKEARGPLLMILTNDVVMRPGSGEALVKAMDDPTVGIVGMKLLFPTEAQLTRAGLKHSEVQRSPETVQHVGLFTNLHGQVIHMYLGWSADNPRVNAMRDVYAVTGAAFLVRRKLFWECGGFDPAFGAGTFEDVSLCLSIRERGARVIVEVGAVGTHYNGATAEKHNLAFPLSQNRMIFEEKWRNKLIWSEWWAW